MSQQDCPRGDRIKIMSENQGLGWAKCAPVFFLSPATQLRAICWLMLAGLTGMAHGACASSPCSAKLPTSPLTATLNGRNYSGLANRSTRFEFRWHGNITDNMDHVVLNVGSIQVRILNGNQLWATDYYDTTENNGCSVAPWANHSDVLIRVTRDLSLPSGALRMEVFDTAIGDKSLQSCSSKISSIAAYPAAAFDQLGVSIGGPNATGNIGFLRWYDSIVPASTMVPFSASGNAGTLGDFEFENNLGDSSGNGTNLSGTQVSYVSSPAYPPNCNAGKPQSFRVGFQAVLDGSQSTPLDESAQLMYSWQSVDAPEQVVWIGDSNRAGPAFQPGSFGSYNFQLTVTDSIKQSTTCTVKHGAVATDDNDVVLIPDPTIALLLSPMLRWGASPWPWFDRQHKYLADVFGALQASDYADTWNTASPGTVKVGKGSPVITGTGTSFKRDFCGGGNTSNGSPIVIWYPLGDGTFGRWPGSVTSCDSDIQITLASPYQIGPSTDGLSYSVMTNQQVFTWVNGSTNANYYDNVMAFYVLYFRTGIDTYLTYARTLADRWWSLPYVDQGRTCELAGIFPCFTARQRSFTGLVLRALDGRPDMWPGLRKWWDFDRYVISNPGGLYDLREQSYQIADVSLCALFDPDSNHKQLCAKDVVSAIGNFWVPNEQPGGYWLSPSFGFSTWNGFPGSVSVVHGLDTVQGVGTTWTSGQFPASFSFWVTQSGPDSSNGDPTSYTATFVDATHVTLDRPYQGTSGSGRGWQNNNLVGPGTQPFMMGIAAEAFNLAYLATGDSRARQLVIDSANWIAQSGYRASMRGLYYGRKFVNCEPIKENIPNCSDDHAEDARFYSGEVINAFSQAYLLTGDPSLRTMGDNLFGAMFGKPGFGGPQSDGIYLTEIDDGGLAFSSKKAKDFGFFYGFGQAWTWLAARISSGNMMLALNLRSVPHAASVRLTPNRTFTLKAPVAPAITCQTTPCVLPKDACRPGCPVTIEFLSESGKILGTTVRSVTADQRGNHE
jgi:hypothetical protein